MWKRNQWTSLVHQWGGLDDLNNYNNFPTLGVTEHDNSTKLYASDLPDFVYCKRLFFIKKTMDIPRVETSPMLWGTIEHEIRRSLARAIRPEYESCNDIESLQNLNYQSAIDGALDYGMELGRTVKPQYYLRLEEIQPHLRYRLQIEEKQRREKAVKMARRGIKLERIFDELLPWKFEIGVGSRELGITGRIDQVFKINTSLIPLDFKTHRNRIAALIFKESHFEQLAVYALLLEQKYPEYSANMGIIKYTEDLHDEKFPITTKAKKNVIEHIKQTRELIQKNELPPKLSGEQSIKCESCYLKNFCFGLEKGEITKC